MNLFLQNKLNDSKRYFKLRKFFKNKLEFPFYSNYHKLRFRAKKLNTNRSIFFQTLRYIPLQLCLSLIFVVLCQTVGLHTGLNASFFHFEYSADLNDNLGIILSVCVTVIGVLLGLYFSALSSVGGSQYMRAPESLQNLFKNEPVGKQYVGFIIFTTNSGIIYLLLGIFDIERSLIGVFILILLSMYCVINLLIVTPRTFYFINPRDASRTLSNSIKTNIKHVSYSSFGSHKPELQNYYSLEVSKTFGTFEDLIKFMGSDTMKVSPGQYFEVAVYISGLLKDYIKAKKRIPRSSLWYQKSQKYDRWALADHFKVEMAINSGSSLMPSEYTDYMWFEKRAIQQLLNILNILYTAEDVFYVQKCLQLIVKILEDTGSEFAIEVTELIVNDIFVWSNTIVTKNNGNDSEFYNAIFDSVGMILQEPTMSLMQYLDETMLDSIVQKIGKIAFDKRKCCYTSSLPESVLNVVEEEFQKIQAEKEIEDKVLTPRKYFTSKIIQRYIQDMMKYYDISKGYAAKLGSISDILAEKKLANSASSISSRRVELSKKLVLLSQLVRTFIETSKNYKYINDLPWAEWNEENEIKFLQCESDVAVDNMANLIPLLINASQEQQDSGPDYFGEAYTHSIQAFYQAISENKTECALKLLRNVFVGNAFMEYDLNRLTKDWANENYRISVIAETMFDILSLSGFIKIYAELYDDNRVWDLCIKLWEDALNNHTHGASARIATLVITGKFAKNTSIRNYFSAQNLLRTSWEQEFKQLIKNKSEELGITDDLDNDKNKYMSIFGTASKKHKSLLISEIISNWGYMDIEPIQVFFAAYLSDRDEAKNLDLGAQFSTFKRYKEAISNQGGDNDEKTTTKTDD